jgi:hypothetical protein
VVLLALLEHVEVVDDILLLSRVHGQLVERLGVVERDMGPNISVETAAIIRSTRDLYDCRFKLIGC